MRGSCARARARARAVLPQCLRAMRGVYTHHPVNTTTTTRPYHNDHTRTRMYIPDLPYLFVCIYFYFAIKGSLAGHDVDVHKRCHLSQKSIHRSGSGEARGK
ncbi:hypothetical protein H2248_012040 [Termitomyces sp. 'cryptogamus']|nr:hypothetical protein H2248_012040 [Termitomyces sp. 'cryptogamus']